MKKGTTILASALIAAASISQGLVSNAQTSSSSQPASEEAIRPFKVNIPEARLTDLRRRIQATQWPEQEIVTDATQGVQLATMKELAKYWATYDWRKTEKKLNALPQFMTNIDGIDIHFIQVKSKHKNALPIIITHGWPGSIIEQLKIIGPLTDPTAYGGKAEDAFDVVIPSLPGHGFSGKPTVLGWEPVRIAKAWITLMKRLGYNKYVAQGGDWGDAVTEQMAVLAPPELIGIHTNMAATVPADINKILQAGGPEPAGLSADEQHAFKQLDFFYKNGLSYALEMAHRPQTLYGIADSPIGLAGWILDHDAASLALITRVFKGESAGLTKEDIVENITLYWLTNTGISSARLYWENKLPFFDIKNIKIPVAVSAFPDELYQVPKSWAEKAFPNLLHYNKLDVGGHFAAWEQPKLFTDEMRASFQSLRNK